MATGEWGGIQSLSPTLHRIRYTADTGDGRGRVRHSETFRGKKRDAQRRKAELQTLYDKGVNVRKAMTFQQLWEMDVLPEMLEEMAPNTLKAYLSEWEHVKARWGNVKLDSYNGAEVESWLKRELPCRTGRACLTLMRKVSNRAYLLGMTGNDPLAAKLSVSKTSKREKERTELDVAPYIELARSIGPGMYAGVILMACGGCRVGEAMAVRADSVRWDEQGGRALFDVVDEVCEEGGLAGRLKNSQSRRTASVPGSYGAELARLAEEALARGDVYMVDRGGGQTVSMASFRSLFKRRCAAAGLEWVTMRSLRRSFATIMLNAGADSGDVNISMGHTRDSRVIFTNYDRPDQSVAPNLPHFPS